MWFQEYLLHPSVLTIWGSDEDLTPLSQAKVFFTVRSMGQRKVSFYVPFWEKSLRIGRVNSGNQECPLCLIIFDPITALITTCRDVCLREKAFSFVRVWRLRSTLYLVPYDWKHGLWSSHMCVTWELVGMWTWHGQALFLVHCYILMDWSSARYIEGIQWMREWMSSGRAERWIKRCLNVGMLQTKGGEWMPDEWTHGHAILGVSVKGSFPAGTGPWKGGWRCPEDIDHWPKRWSFGSDGRNGPGKQLDFFRDIGQAHVWGLK